MASSSESTGMIVRTGPKISSWAMAIFGLTSEKTVGRTKNPVSSPSGASTPPIRSFAPSSIPERM
jgi:hypothetical protein